MTRDEAERRLSALTAVRDNWLADKAPTLSAQAVWLIGSLGQGSGDRWSDLDLLVVDGDCALEDAVLTIELPENGPVDGNYIGAMYDGGGLPLWIDWYLWPRHAPIPVGSRLVAGTGTAGGLDLGDTLSRIGRGRRGAGPDPGIFALAMIPLAAKFVARGEVDKATAMAAMLGTTPDVAGLSAVLSQLEGHAVARGLVGRFLEVVGALR